MNHRRRGLTIGAALTVVALAAVTLGAMVQLAQLSLRTARQVRDARNATAALDAAVARMHADALAAPATGGDRATLDLGDVRWELGPDGTLRRDAGGDVTTWTPDLADAAFVHGPAAARLTVGGRDAAVLYPLTGGGR